MSLDVYLESPGQEGPARRAIFVRESGGTVEISREEWDRRHPGTEPSTVDIGGGDEVYSSNITHNLNTMADAAGIYQHLWRPEEVQATKACDLIGPLADGLGILRADPEKFKKLNPENGWGDYEGLVEFVEKYLAACKANPDAMIRVSR
jgi:hypothetical protein